MPGGFNISKTLSSVLSMSERAMRKLNDAAGFPTAKVISDDFIPGDVDIKRISLTSLANDKFFDLTGQAKVINIYESIFSPCIFAEIEMQDSLDLKNDFDIRQGDRIVIEFNTPKTENSVELVFGVVELSSTTIKENLMMKSYVISLASLEALNNSVLSLSLKQKDSVSKVVKRIFDDNIKTDKKVYIDSTKGIEDLPPLSAIRPFKAISYLIEFAYSSRYKSNAYVFFENKRGFHFTSVEKLIKQGVDAQAKGSLFTDKEFYFDLASRENLENIAFRNIISYKKLSTNSFSEMSKVTNIVKSFDFTRGNYVEFISRASDVNFDLLDGISTSKNKPIFDDFYNSSTTNVEFIPICSDTMNKNHGEYIASRKSFARMMEQDTIRILIYGDTELNCGDVIKCNFPNVSSFDNTEGKPEMETGNYLITALRHMILNSDRPQHLVSMELKRNRAQ